MNVELKKKLLNEINKSGFPLELEAIEKLRNVSFNVYPNFTFSDDESKPHEIDAYAMLSDEIREGVWPYGTIGLSLFVECKVSKDKPWVFFQEAYDLMASTYGLVERLKCATDIRVNKPSLLLAGCYNSPLASHHYGSGVPVARSYFEAFGKDAGKEIYQAVTNIWYALDFHQKFFEQSTYEGQPPEIKRSIFLHGVIVFRGVLAVAERKEEGFDLSEVPHVLLRTTDCITDKSLPFGFDRETVIDVVHIDYLDKYLSVCQKDLRLCIEHLKQLAQAEFITGEMKVNSLFDK